MNTKYTAKNTHLDPLTQKRVVILGYGSQGRAQALNLKESGIKVTLGLRPKGPSWALAIKEGWTPCPIEEATRNADILVFLFPDMEHASVFEHSILPYLKKGALLLFSHGFSIHYGLIKPPQHVDIALVAPKGPGHLVRQQYTNGQGVPCLIATHQNKTGEAHTLALSYAHHIGGTRAGILKTTFKEETETDLFGEQAVLCGGVTELVKAGWQTLVDAGYQKEIAYFECLHELKLIVDLLYTGGLTKMHQCVSETAKYGGLTRGPRIIDAHAKKQMRMILANIQEGHFAREWIKEHHQGEKHYRHLLKQDCEHPLETIGAQLRQSMSWLYQKENAS